MFVCQNSEELLWSEFGFTLGFYRRRIDIFLADQFIGFSSDFQRDCLPFDIEFYLFTLGHVSSFYRRRIDVFTAGSQAFYREKFVGFSSDFQRDFLAFWHRILLDLLLATFEARKKSRWNRIFDLLEWVLARIRWFWRPALWSQFPKNSMRMSPMHPDENGAAQVQDKTKPKKNDWRTFEIGFKFNS